ncbi:hypothetical protein [Streptomyces sp. NPDC051776]|uniref:hypothetical protein n=1 Tax=Streptomyces sp. NPDC051776 TaxID=3155414 RepID=UPI003426EE27
MDDTTLTFIIQTGLVLTLALVVTLPALLGARRERRIDAQLRDAEREDDVLVQYGRARPSRDEPGHPPVITPPVVAPPMAAPKEAAAPVTSPRLTCPPVAAPHMPPCA